MIGVRRKEGEKRVKMRRKWCGVDLLSEFYSLKVNKYFKLPRERSLSKSFL